MTEPPMVIILTKGEFYLICSSEHLWFGTSVAKCVFFPPDWATSTLLPQVVRGLKRLTKLFVQTFEIGKILSDFGKKSLMLTMFAFI